MTGSDEDEADSAKENAAPIGHGSTQAAKSPGVQASMLAK